MKGIEIIRTILPEPSKKFRRFFLFNSDFVRVKTSRENSVNIKSVQSKNSSICNSPVSYRGIPIPFLNNHKNISYYNYPDFTTVLESKYSSDYEDMYDLNIFKIPFPTYGAVAVINRKNNVVEYKTRVYPISVNGTRYPSYILYNMQEKAVYKIVRVPSKGIQLTIATKKENWKEQSFWVDTIYLDGLNKHIPFVYGFKVNKDNKAFVITVLNGSIVQLPVKKNVITKEHLRNYFFEIDRIQAEDKDNVQVSGSLYMTPERNNEVLKIYEGSADIPHDALLVGKMENNQSIYLSTELKQFLFVKEGKVVKIFPSMLYYAKFKNIQVRNNQNGDHSSILASFDNILALHGMISWSVHKFSVYSARVFSPENSKYFAVVEWIRNDGKKRVLPYINIYDKTTGKKVKAEVMLYKNIHRRGYVVPFNQSGSNRYIVYLEEKDQYLHTTGIVHIIDLDTLKDYRFVLEDDFALSDKFNPAYIYENYALGSVVNYEENSIMDDVYFNFDGNVLSAYQSKSNFELDGKDTVSVHVPFFTINIEKKKLNVLKNAEDTFVFLQDPFFPLEKDMYIYNNKEKEAER